MNIFNPPDDGQPHHGVGHHGHLEQCDRQHGDTLWKTKYQMLVSEINDVVTVNQQNSYILKFGMFEIPKVSLHDYKVSHRGDTVMSV